jgi:two-component system chemotaxis response regulator CheB
MRVCKIDHYFYITTHAKSLDAEVLLIRGIILNGFATKRTIAEAEEEQPE